MRPATLPFSAAGAAGADRAACLTSDSSSATRPRSASASAAAARRWASAAPAVMASIRRIPCEELVSRVTTKGPISAVERTCVPPHSSRLTSGTSTTRTCSPYFSPKSIIAPSSAARSRDVTKMWSGWLATTCSFTVRSTSASSSGVSGPAWRKSNRSLSGPT